MLPADVVARYEREGRWSGQTLAERTAGVAAGRPAEIALIDGTTRLSFDKAAGLIERLAGHLATLGAEPGTVVSWQLPNSCEAALVHHATIRTGAISNPIDPALSERETRAIAADARTTIAIAPESWRGRQLADVWRALGVTTVVARGGGRPPTLDALLERDPPRPAPPPPRDPAATAVLLYTSGTTGDPKGVLHTHRGLLCELDSFVEIHGVRPEDRYLGGAPVAHIAGLVYGVMAPFAHGTSTVFLERWDPARAVQLIGAERVTFMTGPPTFLQTMAEHAGAADTSSFRLFSTGGASISAELIRAAGARLRCVVKRAYGSTEVPTLTATTLHDDERARTETDGRVLGGGEIRLVDGEIWARAPEMFVGYTDGSGFTSDGWFRTGDLGMLDDEGLLRITGRLKDIIIRGGENISAAEIEGLLLQHPAIADAAVVGMPDERLGERVCAFVVARGGLTLDDVVTFLRARGIATHKLPERLERCDELPRTASGKVRKHELRARL